MRCTGSPASKSVGSARSCTKRETEAERIRKILASDKKLWGEVRKELEALGEEMGTKRRTALGSSEEITEFDPQAYIVRENTHIVLSTEGWVRRVGKISTLDKLRMREGDQLLNVLPCSTLDNAIFFSSDGTAYTLPAEQIRPVPGTASRCRSISGWGMASRLSTPSAPIRGSLPPIPKSKGSLLRLRTC